MYATESETKTAVSTLPNHFWADELGCTHILRAIKKLQRKEHAQAYFCHCRDRKMDPKSAYNSNY
jgi:hypothetical protein